MMRASFLCLFSFMFALSGFGKSEPRYPVSLIPEELKAGANSVVRHQSTSIDVIGGSEFLATCTSAVTLLNANAKDEAVFTLSVSSFSQLKSFEGAIYSADGALLRKIKKGDLKYTEFSDFSTLVDDYATYYYSPDIISYPVTVEYTYTERNVEFTPSYYSFSPVTATEQSVQTASYSIAVPQGMNLITDGGKPEWRQPQTTRKDGKTVYEWKAENLPAIKTEPYMPPVSDWLPVLNVMPEQFSYNGTLVSNSSWKTYGHWMHTLTEGREALPEELKSKVHELTDGLTDDYSKAKVLYDYMSQTCRYVSIQLGIGGLQSRSAAETYATKFGDCKALSLYLKAMLAECGISSNLCIISTWKERLPKELPVTRGLNHMILRINLSDGPLWVECTNSQLPFGYIHSKINGHDAIVLSNRDSHLETLPKNTSRENIDSYSNKIVLNADGSAQISFCRTAEGNEYETLRRFKNATADKQKEMVKEMLALQSVRVAEVQTAFRETATPSDNASRIFMPTAKISGTLTADGYSSATKNRLTVPVQFMRGRFSRFKTQRSFDIFIGYSYTISDSLTIKIPQGYKQEVLPPSVSLHTAFGDLNCEYKYDEASHSVVVGQMLTVAAGNYSRSEAQAFADFLSAINKHRAASIVLIRKADD